MNNPNPLVSLFILDRDVLQFTLRNSPDLAKGMILTAVVDTLVERYEDARMTHDLGRAINLYKKAMSLTPSQNSRFIRI